MPRALFQKSGNAVWISHLDLMRLFQRSFKRADLPLTHTQGFNPRPSVSIALPLSVGIESRCELLEFDLEGELPAMDQIRDRLNEALVDGVQVLEVYTDGMKLKNLAYLECIVTLEYDAGIPENAELEISALFARQEVLVEKRSKNGYKEENIIPMIRSLRLEKIDGNCLALHGRVCCQNPTLNPMLLAAAIEKYLPGMKPDFVRCCRLGLLDINESTFR